MLLINNYKLRRRVGVTLIELLVVVAIATLLLATSIPLMKPALQSGKVREASRQLNVFIQVARARAIETGRTSGIWIERQGAGSNAGVEVYIAETPLPYQGDTLSATAVSFGPTSSPSTSGTIGFRDVNFDFNSSTLPFIVEVGDVIKFDYKGHYYPIKIISTKSSGPYVEVDVSSHALPPVAGTRYQIFRRPRKSLATPLQLTGNVALDLRYSGIGRTTTYSGATELSGREFKANASTTGTTPVVIAFNASGVVDHVSYSGVTVIPSGSIHLLIGRSDQVDEPSDDIPNDIPVTQGASVTHAYSKNVSDSKSVWLTIQPRNGAVTSAENGWVIFDSPTPYQQYDPTNTNGPNLADSLLYAREFAQSSQSIGGN